MAQVQLVSEYPDGQNRGQNFIKNPTIKQSGFDLTRKVWVTPNNLQIGR